ncbi:MAG TPA: N-acetyltransferase, partial [Chloroflexia bacterium]|nr:N-acetyltransferase [Chloroflexia bacterium]
MRIVNLTPEDEGLVRQVAALLVEAFREHWPEAWPDIDSALAEVRESFAEGRISRVAVGEGGEARGWIGGVP